MSVDSNSEVLDTFNPISVSVKDTCNQAVSETMEVPASHILKDNKPNEWVQLLLPIFITLFVVFVEKWVTRWYSHSDEKEARKQFRDTVLDWIVKIEPIERSFRQSVQQLVDDIHASDDMLPVSFVMPLTLHDKMKEVSVEKMTDAFLKDFEKDKKICQHVQHYLKF